MSLVYEKMEAKNNGVRSTTEEKDPEGKMGSKKTKSDRGC